MTSPRLSPQQLQKQKQSFRNFLFGESNGYEMLQAFKSIPNVEQKLLEKNILEVRKFPNLTHKEQMQINAKKYTEVFRLAKESKNPEIVFRNPDWFVELYGMVLNTGAFLVTIQLIGNQQQVQKWRELVLNGKVMGGYGQTELGHGSNVQALQTEAHFDQERGAFIINTPKNTATKFWPGCFGLYSTHCVLQAKTIVKGKNIGVQTFIIPMRDQYLNPLPGIQGGDIGPKIGFLKVDNGYLKLNNVQIPLQNMLSRYVQVKPNGQVIGLQNKQAIKYGYGSMLNLRIKLVVGFALPYTYGPGVIQYEICEKNGKLNDPLIKKRLIETMCTGIGTTLANVYVGGIFNRFLAALEKKDYNQADKLLVSCHIISSTFKALSSWKAQETLRQLVTFNQFGSFQSTYLPKYLTDCIPSVTYEGDNVVLLQQTAKFILVKEKETQLVKPSSSVNTSNLPQVLAVMKFITSSQIRNLKQLIQTAVEAGNDFKNVWNEIYQQKIIEVSRLWGRMTLLQLAMETLNRIKENKTFYEKIVQVFASALVQETKEIYFYGFEVKEPTAWKELTDDQLEVLRDMNRPVRRENEPQTFETRGNKDVADWIYSRL